MAHPPSPYQQPREQPRRERRSSERHKRVLRAALLEGETFRELCLIHNISTGGLMARVFSRVAIDETITATLKNGHSVRGRVIWVKDNNIGIEFDQPVDVSLLLSVGRSDNGGVVSRMPRIQAEISAAIWQNGRRILGKTLDISQGGAKLTLMTPPELGPAKISIAEMNVEGAIRWIDGARAGVSFNVPVRLEVVASIIQSAKRKS